MSVTIINADVIEGLRSLADESVHCCVTSPPYFGLRDYGVDGQIGLETTPDVFVARLVEVFREVRRVLRSDGTLWLNIGDSYANDGKWGGATSGKHVSAVHGESGIGRGKRQTGLKPKDLIGIPWMLAFALRADGWWLRQDIIWAKPNPMPESVTDRCTKAHEYVFLLTKSERYFYDAEAIKEAAIWGAPNSPQSINSPYGQGFTRRAKKVERGHEREHEGFAARWDGMTKAEQAAMGRNKRSVWSIATTPFPEAHFATFPTELPENCVKAGTSKKGCCPTCAAPWERQTVGWYPSCACYGVPELPAYPPEPKPEPAKAAWREACTAITARRNELIGAAEALPVEPAVVLDPFSGAGTTALVADRLQRHAIGVELNPEYAAMSERRINGDRGGLLDAMEAAQ